jgi:predicted alpha/beta hydrolase family esterase
VAADWGATFYNIGPRGHINAESGLGDWDEGLALLRSLAPAIDTR